MRKGRWQIQKATVPDEPRAFRFSVSEDKIQEMLFGDRGVEVLMQQLWKQLLQAQMTEHLGAAPGEPTGKRRGHRNGSYRRKFTTRVGTLELEVPRDRVGTFQTEPFARYARLQTTGSKAHPLSSART